MSQHEDSDVESLVDKDVTTPTPTNHTNLGTRMHKRKREETTLNDFSNFKEEMRTMITSMLAVQMKEIKKNSNTLKDIQQVNKNIENSVAFLSAQHDEFLKKIQKLESLHKEDKKYIIELEHKIEELQKKDRTPNFEIKNTPKGKEEKKENLVNMVLNLSKTINCPLGRSDIKDVYRVRAKKDGSSLNTPVIVETTSTLLKNDILKKCKAFNESHNEKLRAIHLGIPISQDTPIYVAEQLTPKAARLYFLARGLKKAGLYKLCWTSYGNVYLRKEENSQIILVSNEAQIQELSNQK